MRSNPSVQPHALHDVLSAKCNSECIVGGEADGSWERRSRDPGVAFEIEPAGNIGDEAEFAFSDMSVY